MSQIIDIANWVINDVLNRSSDVALQTIVINAAVSVYQVICAAVPFDELMTTSPELALTAGQDTYQLGVNFVLNPTLRAIADIRITFDSQTKRRLRRSHTRVYDSLSFSSNSRPATYARWGNFLQLSPPPDSSSYTVRFRYWQRPTIAGTPSNTTLLTPVEWDILMKYETLFQTYIYLDRQNDAYALMQPQGMPRQPGSPRKQRSFEVGIIPKLWNDLLTTASQKENVDEDFGINPIIRNYSVRP